MAETTRSSVIEIHQNNYSPPKWSYIADMECILLSWCTNIYPCCRAQQKCLRYRPCGLVYINIPGRTCLRELFIKYEQVIAWVAGFLPTNWRQIIINRRLHWMDQWTCAQIVATTVKLNFKQPVGRNHWLSCWHGSYGIIYNPLQSPQPSMDSHRAINANDIQVMPVYIMVKYGEPQANSSSHLWDSGATMTWLNEYCQFQQI